MLTVTVTVTAASAVTAVTGAAVTAATAAAVTAATAAAVTAPTASAVTAASAASAASAVTAAHVSSASAASRSRAYAIVILCRTPGRPHHGLDPAMTLAKDLRGLRLDCGAHRDRIRRCRRRDRGALSVLALAAAFRGSNDHTSPG